MPLVYEEHFTALNTECDPWDRMTPGSVLRRVQDISIAQCEQKGLNEALYQKTQTTFLLAKLSLVIGRMPAVGERVRMETRAYGARRALYHRVTSLHAEDGAKLCEADSRWVLINTATRRIMRQPPEEFAHVYVDTPGEEEHELSFPKPGRLFPLGEVRASYTLCDRNGHVNNTKYADLVCDHLPLERLSQGMPKQMLLCYHSEIPLGSTFSLCSAPEGDTGFYFLAQSEDTKHFECFVRFG